MSFLLSFIIIFYYRIEVLYYFSEFFIKNYNFIYTHLADAFIVYLKLSFIVSFFFNIPLICYLLGFYILKGYYNIYLKIIFFNLIILNILFFCLILLISKKVIPEFISFFFQFNIIEPYTISLQAKLDEYFSFFFIVLFCFILLCIIPFVICFLFKNLNNVLTKKLIYGVFFIIFIFIAPPDFLLQLFFIIPFFFILELFYYCSILIINFFKIYKV